jgi:hypothetical protein
MYTLYTVVVHYLQMCMKKYGCCPKFKGEIIQLMLSRKILDSNHIASCTSAGSVLQMCKVS